MWVSDKWRDFELLDCSRGEKLERWGRYTVVRPDPQAIWDTPRSDRRWQHCDGRYTRSASGGGSWDRGSLPASWQISYGELKFNVKPMSFKHTGLFPGAGGELGLHHAQDPLRRKAGQRAQPLCVYRRGHRGRPCRRRERLPCGRGQGHGGLGEGKRRVERRGGPERALDS